MFEILDSEIELIDQFVLEMDQTEDLNKLGGWGIVHLVCGAYYAQQERVKRIIIQKLNEPMLIFNYYDEDYAVVFAEHLKQWAESDGGLALAERRLKTQARALTVQQFKTSKRYLGLSIVLNSLKDLSCDEELARVGDWTRENKYGWQKLFFGAGMLLTNDAKFYWSDYSECLQSMKGSRDRFEKLFKHFE